MTSSHFNPSRHSLLDNLICPGLESGSGVVSAQPIHDEENQITDPDEIRSGDLIREHRRDGTSKFEVWRAPYEDNGSIWIAVRPLQNSDIIRGLYLIKKSLADKAIVPYGNGKWNRFNWLEKVNFDPETGFRLRSFGQADLLAPGTRAFLRTLAVYDKDTPDLEQFYVFEPSVVLAMTSDQINIRGVPIWHRTTLHAYYRGEEKTKEWKHAGPQRQLRFDGFETVSIDRGGDRVKITAEWKEDEGGAPKSHTFEFTEPAEEVEVL